MAKAVKEGKVDLFPTLVHTSLLEEGKERADLVLLTLNAACFHVVNENKKKYHEVAFKMADMISSSFSTIVPSSGSVSSFVPSPSMKGGGQRPSLTSLVADSVNRRDSKTSTHTRSSSASFDLAEPCPRPLLTMSPTETEPASFTGIGSARRPVAEVDALNNKHEAEFRVLVPSIGEALESALMMQRPPNSPEEGTGIGCRLSDISAPFATYNTVVPSSLGIQTYVKRIAEYTFLSPATLVVAVILMERMLDKHQPQLALTRRNVHKLFLVSARVASKMIDLKALNNANFAKVGGISNQHLNDMEAKFLMDLEFDVFVTAKEFFTFVCKFSEPAALMKCFQQGFEKSNASASGTSVFSLNTTVAAGRRSS